MTVDQSSLRLQRTLAAPPARVYRAWLEPELLQRWMSPASFEVSRVEVDERPGGHLHIWQTSADGDVGGMEGDILELVPDERIVFDWRFVGPGRERDLRLDSRLSITLRAVPEGTELTLVHELLDPLREAMPQVADNVSRGWGMALDKLEAAL